MQKDGGAQKNALPGAIVRPSRRWAWLAALSIVAAAFPPAWQASHAQSSQTPATQRYDIPAQPLAAALARYAQISHVDIIYDHTLAERLRSAPVSGQLTPQQALARMLAGTGLSFRFTRENAALIYGQHAAATVPGYHPDGAAPLLALDTMQVRGAPTIGARESFDGYGRHVLEAIDRLLRPDAVANRREYRLVMRIWIERDGRVGRADFSKGSGDASIDRDMIRQVSELRFDAPPPSMPQPIRVQLEAR